MSRSCCVLVLYFLVPVATDELSFLLLGDWGKGGSGQASRAQDSNMIQPQATSYQLSVAKAMNTYTSSADNKPSFIVALGDNFYDDGVSSSTDSLWLNLWKYVYLLDYPDLYIPWYPVLGNHDWNGAPLAQIQRFHDHTDDDIWMAESTNFTKTFPIPGSDSAYVLMVFLDTTTLAPSQTKATSQYSSSVKEAWIQNQLQHLTSYLSEATSSTNPPTWIFVAGHYPVFSCGDHGDISELTTDLLPLLEKFGVDAYFAGHDHISEHLTHNQVDYFVAGAGSMTDSLKTASAASLLWSGTGYCAFGVVSADTEKYTVRFIDTSNQVKYEAVRYKRSSAVSAGDPIASPSKAPTITDVINFLPSTSRTAERLTSYQRVPLLVIGGTALSLVFILAVGYVAYRRSNSSDNSKGDSERGGAEGRISRKKRRESKVLVVPKSIHSTKGMSKRRLLSLGLQAIQYEEVDQLPAITAISTADEEQGGAAALFDRGHSTYITTMNYSSSDRDSSKHKRAVSMPV